MLAGINSRYAHGYALGLCGVLRVSIILLTLHLRSKVEGTVLFGEERREGEREGENVMEEILLARIRTGGTGEVIGR